MSTPRPLHGCANCLPAGTPTRVAHAFHALIKFATFAGCATAKSWSSVGSTDKSYNSGVSAFSWRTTSLKLPSIHARLVSCSKPNLRAVSAPPLAIVLTSDLPQVATRRDRRRYQDASHLRHRARWAPRRWRGGLGSAAGRCAVTGPRDDQRRTNP